MAKSYLCTCTDVALIQFEHMLPANPFSTGQAHIWIAGTCEWLDYMYNFKSILSEEELSKASKFKLKKDQELYIISHGLLRVILSKYITITPGDLVFQRTGKGKPFLQNIGKKYFFNLSHTEAMVIIAINWIDEIGVDIEKINSDFSWQEIAQYYYNVAELTNLNKVGKDSAIQLFYTYWTRKESFLKAIGLGLIDDIRSLEVSSAVNSFHLADDEVTKSVRGDWNTISFPINDYLASVTFSPDLQQVKFYNGNQLLDRI